MLDYGNDVRGRYMDSGESIVVGCDRNEDVEMDVCS